MRYFTNDKLPVVKPVTIIEQQLNLCDEHILAKVIDIRDWFGRNRIKTEKITFFSLSDKYNASATE